MRYLLLLLVACCTRRVLLGALAALGPNIVLNPGVETGSISFKSGGSNITGVRPDNWFDNTDWAVPVPKLTYSFSTTNQRTTASKRSWCVTVSRPGFAQCGQPLALRVGTDYSTSAYFRTTSTAAVTVRLGIQGAFAPWPLWGSVSGAVSSSNGWRQLVLPNLSTLPSGPASSAGQGLVDAWLLLYVDTPGVAVCVDDASSTAITCTGNPTAPANATFNCTGGTTSASTGSVCTASCARGSTGSPTPSATCLATGVWGAVSGRCVQANCTGNPPNPTNGVFSCAPSTPIGGRCNATCSSGFVGSPAPTAVCDASATWGALTGVCASVPNLLLNPGFENGSTSFSSGGANITGLRPDNWGDNTEWAVPVPKLTYSFSTTNQRTAASKRSWCVSVGTPGFAQFGQPLALRIGTDYSMSAYFHTTSTAAVTVRLGIQGAFAPWPLWGSVSGTVSSSNGWRQLVLPNLSTLPSGPASSAGQGLVDTMVLLYVDTPGVAVCVDDAMLTTTAPEATCSGNPTAPANATFNCTTPAPLGSVCTASCARGFTGSPTPSATCLADGVWGAANGTCIRANCTGNPPNPADGAFSCPPSTPVGGRCNATCANGFSGNPTPSATCSTAATWNSVTGVCSPTVNCTTRPADPVNGAFTSCAVPAAANTRCVATCASGFAGSPTPATTCQANGTWNAVTGVCSPVLCLDQPPAPLYGAFTCPASASVNSVCNGTCSSGYTGSPAPSAACTATGTWSVSGQCVNAAPQVLLNPNFETGSTTISINGGAISGVMPDSWQDNSGWASPSPSLIYSLSTASPRTSTNTRSMCVQVNSGFAQLVQGVTLQTATDYTLSAWFRVSAATTSPVGVTVALQAASAPYDWWGNTGAQLTVASGWSQLVVRNLNTVMPGAAGGTVAALFILRVETAGATVCFDDASLQRVGPGAPELLSNAGFDGGDYTSSSAGGTISGTWPDGWGDNTDWVVPVPTITGSVVSGLEARTGKAAKILVTSGFTQFAQRINALPGTAYRLSIWVRATPPAGQAGVAVTLQLRLSGSPYTGFGSATAVVGGSWTQLIVPSAILPPGGASPVNVGFMINTGGPGTIWLDDASLTALPATAALPDQALRPPAAKPIDRSYWCMNINHMFANWSPWQTGYLWPVVDFGIWRTWDSEIVWATVQPTDANTFSWGQMDQAVGQAVSRGQKVLFTLGQPATWASSNPTLQSVYGPGRGSPPARVSDWKAFVTALERRYKGIIMGYEVWNEPNLQGDNGFYNGSPEQLSALALATQQVLQAEGSSAWLINPPMAGLAADAVTFLSRYFTECARLGVTHQGLSWHSYNMPAELDKVSVDTLRSIMASQGLPADLPILNTEGGILDGDFAALGNNHTKGAAYLAKMYTVDWALGVQHACWYAYDAASMEGLTTSNYSTTQQPYTLNTAGLAYNRMITWLQNATMVSMVRTQGVWVAALTCPVSPGSATLTRSWVVWNGDGRVSQLPFAVPAGWGVTVSEDLLTGTRTSLPAGGAQSVWAGEIPQLLRQS